MKSVNFSVTFLNHHSKNIYLRKKAITLGISPFTSKYNKNYISNIIDWACANFSQVFILLAGKEAKNLLECLGMSTIKAERKVNKEIRRQKRFCIEALSKNNYATNTIFTFSDFKNSEYYEKYSEKILKCYESDLMFQKLCKEMSKQAMISKAKSLSLPLDMITEKNLEYASKYVLAELPFFLNSNPIFKMEENILAYHRDWPLGNYINKNIFPLKISQNQGYIIIEEETS
ncbi:tRNA-dependent cyclodipeptide synthase [Staphylococcus simulans]